MEHNIEELSGILRNRADIFYVKVMRPNLTSSLVFSWNAEWGRQSKRYSPAEFRQHLQEAGITATLFESKGTDIAAGCGMMTTRFRGRKGRINAEDLSIPQADPSKVGF